MPVGAIIGGVASIGSALIGSHAASKAAKTQANAANHAADLQNQQYQQTRQDLAPYRAAGGNAITDAYAMTRPGYDYTASPGYQFQLDQGLGAIQNSAAAKGQLMSGGTYKDLASFASGLAAQDFNQSFNRLASIASGGQQANSTLGQLGAASANAQGDYLTQAANARASGYAGQANAFGGALNNLAYMGMNGSFNGLFGGGAAPQASLAPSVTNLINSNPGLF